MRALAFEIAFRRWMEERAMRWECLRYPRPEAGGETVAYRLAPAAPPRAVVLVAHGAGNDALFSFVGLFKELLLRGFEVFTFDLDGHGRSSTTRFHADSVRSAVPEAVRRSGAGERGLAVHALGVSLGGALLLAALPGLSPLVRSVVLLVTPLRIRFSGAAVRGELGTPLLRTLWRERAHYGLLGLVPSFGPFKRGTYPLRLAQTPPPGAFGYVEVLDATLDALRLEDAARALSLPVLLVYGEADRLVPVEQGERLAALVPRAELLRVPRGTHLATPLLPAVTRRVAEWVEAASTAGGEA